MGNYLNENNRHLNEWAKNDGNLLADVSVPERAREQVSYEARAKRCARTGSRSPETLRGAPNLTCIFTKKTFTPLSAEVRTRFNSFE